MQVGIGMFLTIILAAAPANADMIRNTVSVESDSGSNNQSASLTVKTVVNGKVLEDYQETDPSGNIFYNSVITDDELNRQLRASTSRAESESTTAESMEALIALLQQLISLLTKASADL